MRGAGILVWLCACIACNQATASTLTLSEASVADLQEAMQSGATSSVELTVLYLNRIMAYDRRGPRLNAVPVLNPAALTEASRADALRSRGVELSPLQGIPFIVKDSYNVAGLPTSVGLAAWKDLRPPTDAFVVARMRQGGAVLLGKANLDTFASNSEGVSEDFGAVRNPYGAKAVGGSSAGSAVAVAARFAPIAFGGDTAGSLRMPASRNDVVSLRPTLGLLSTAGTAPGDPLFDVVGPMTTTVADLTKVLDWVVHQDGRNPLKGYLPPLARQRPESYVTKPPPRSLRGMTFGVPRRLVSSTAQAPKYLTPGKAILHAFANVRRKLVAAGARIIDVDVPADEVLDDTWYYDQDVSQAGQAARDIYEARVALVNIRVFASEFEKFCSGWCGDPSARMLDVAALFDYPEFMQAFAAMRDGRELDIDSPEVAKSLRNAAEIAGGNLFARWMSKEGIDALLFPAHSDADSDTRFGLNYLSELGAPGLFVPATFIDGPTTQIREPLGVALVVGRFQEARLLELGAAVESTLRARSDPARTPPLDGETLTLGASTAPARRTDKQPPLLTIDAVDSAAGTKVVAKGHASDPSGLATLRIYVDGNPTTITREGDRWTAMLERDRGSDAPCVPDGLIVAFAKDSVGNAAATSRPIAPAGNCSHD